MELHCFAGCDPAAFSAHYLECEPSVEDEKRTRYAISATASPSTSILSSYNASGAKGSAVVGPGGIELIMAAALQQLDLDVLSGYWSPPSSLIDVSLLQGIPPHGIGRPCKVGKEGIVGLLKALEIFLAEGDAARHARWLAAARLIRDGLKSIPHAHAEIYSEDGAGSVPIHSNERLNL